MNKKDLSPKEQYEKEKEERIQKREEERKKDLRSNTFSKMKTYFIYGIVLAAIIFGGYLLLQSQTPEGEDFSIEVPIDGSEHVQVGSSPVEYSSNPPSSGPHYPNTARIGFYEEPVDDRYLIHNLEHGDVWIAYHPRVSEEAKSVLEDLTGGRVIATPREENEFDISLVAWGRLDSFNLEGGIVPEERINDFILRYQSRGPEQVRPNSIPFN